LEIKDAPINDNTILKKNNKIIIAAIDVGSESEMILLKYINKNTCGSIVIPNMIENDLMENDFLVSMF